MIHQKKSRGHRTSKIVKSRQSSGNGHLPYHLFISWVSARAHGWRGMWICVGSKDAQKQLARTSLIHNSFSYETLCTRTRFETEAQGESEMVCYMKLTRNAGKPVRVSYDSRAQVFRVSSAFASLVPGVVWDYSKSNQKVKQYKQKLQNSNQNPPLNLWFSIISVWTTQPWSSVFRLG